MKKNVLSIILSAMVLLGTVAFSACGNGDKLAELEAKIAEQSTKITELEEASAQQSAQIAELNEDKTELQANVATLNTEKENLQNKVEKYQQIIASSPLENGFGSGSGASAPTSPNKVAFKSSRSKFLLDEDITLTFYYGTSIYEGKLQVFDMPSFDIYFKNDESDDMYLVKHVEENFASEKYDIEFFDNGRRFEFTYWEDFTIPKEVFIGNRGYVRLQFFGINEAPACVAIEGRIYKIFASTYFNYTIEDGIVTIGYGWLADEFD